VIEDPPPAPPTTGAPFRDPELPKATVDARERQKALAAVHRKTTQAMARELMREKTGDVFVWVLLAGPIFGAIVVGAMSLLGMQEILWMLCPCSVALVCAILVVRYRAVMRRRSTG
jgi:hypothetical protein